MIQVRHEFAVEELLRKGPTETTLVRESGDGLGEEDLPTNRNYVKSDDEPEPDV